MRRCIESAVLLVIFVTGSEAAAPPQPLNAEQKERIAETSRAVNEALSAGRFDRANERQRQLVALLVRWVGEQHLETIYARIELDRFGHLAKVPKERWPAALQTMKLRTAAFQATGEQSDALYSNAVAAHRKVFGEGHYETIACTMGRGRFLLNQGRHVEAADLLEAATKTARRSLGENHYLVGMGHLTLGQNAERQSKDLGLAEEHFLKSLRILRKAVGETHPFVPLLLSARAAVRDRRGEHRKAEPLLRAALAASVRVSGESGAVTGQIWYDLAANLLSQNKIDEAAFAAGRALAIYRKENGENHRGTAGAYSVLAGAMDAQGRYAETVSLRLRCLKILLSTSGPDSLDAAIAYNGLALTLDRQGRNSVALELHNRALAIRLKKHGTDHFDTAVSYSNVAKTLEKLGRYADAEPLFVKALTIHVRTFGEIHQTTAESRLALAHSLTMQGKHERAAPEYEKGITIYRKLGDPANLGRAVNTLALSYQARNDHKSAHPLYKEAVENLLKALGESHPFVALAYNNLAFNLERLGQPGAALPLFRKALAILIRMVGEDHEFTSNAHVNFASCLFRLGRHAEALRSLQAALPGVEATRRHRAASGFDVALASGNSASARAILAVGLARLKQPLNAYSHAEASLARGLLDDLTPEGQQDADRERELKGSLSGLTRQLLPLWGNTDLSPADRDRRSSLVRMLRAVQSDLTRLASEVSARQVLPVQRIQRAIPEDGALVLWIEEDNFGERWACVLRHRGLPHWQRLTGSGKDGAWAQDDAVAGKLLGAASGSTSDKNHRSRLSTALRKQRLDPLLPWLRAVDGLPAAKRLFVVPVGSMATVPVELIAPEYQVSYVPSGSVLARTAERHRELSASSLLAVGDPVFQTKLSSTAQPPANGVLLIEVQTGGTAEKAGLKPGDVLLAIGDAEIESAEDLPAAMKRAPAELTFWRDGKTGKVKLQGGVPGVRYDRRSARAAWRSLRQQAATSAARGTGHARLPGTRREVEAIVSLVGKSRCTALLGSDASEQRLDVLHSQGKLKGYRVLHFATHGEVDWVRPDRSSLISAQDDLPDALQQARRNRKVYDGRLTVSAIRTWQLDADLVVLSACNTGLGKRAGGDGLLGFAQAFLSRGARSVVLSRWPVDDAATSLLMRRFYQSLLGKREGLKAPMGRAAALQEAKDWLRKLSAKEAQKAVDSLPRSELLVVPTPWGGNWVIAAEVGAWSRGKLVDRPKGEARPFDHPYYWAAFTLVGDPD